MLKRFKFSWGGMLPDPPRFGALTPSPPCSKPSSYTTVTALLPHIPWLFILFKKKPLIMRINFALYICTKYLLATYVITYKSVYMYIRMSERKNAVLKNKNRYQQAFFDVRVFNPNTQTHWKFQIASVYRKQEREKQRTYEQQIREVEMGTFTPLVFSTSGGMAKSTSVAYKRLASLLARKRDQPYSLVLAWLTLQH